MLAAVLKYFAGDDEIPVLSRLTIICAPRPQQTRAFPEDSTFATVGWVGLVKLGKRKEQFNKATIQDKQASKAC
jgi:hypothetical protein